MDRYDAGILNDYGGGNVGWWFDSIRQHLDNAHEFYDAQYADLESEVADLQSQLARANEAPKDGHQYETGFHTGPGWHHSPDCKLCTETADAKVADALRERERKLYEAWGNVNASIEQTRQLTIKSWPQTHSNPPDVEEWRTVIACLVKNAKELEAVLAETEELK